MTEPKLVTHVSLTDHLHTTPQASFLCEAAEGIWAQHSPACECVEGMTCHQDSVCEFQNASDHEEEQEAVDQLDPWRRGGGVI